MVNISATLDYTYPTETVNVNAGDTLFIYVSGPQYLTSWYVSSSSGFSSISPSSASSPGTCTAVVQSSGGSYSIEILGQYYDYDAFSYIDVGYTINGTIAGGGTPPPPPPPPTTTYSVANASTNEGASATVNVTTTNVADGTTLYWTVDAGTSDVSTTNGSFTISSNAGSFTIPAIADSTTEGTEYYTISIRTGSTAGTIVASSTLTINDTSTTPPPPPPPPPATTYTLNFYDPSFSSARTNFNEGEQVYAFLITTAPSGTYYWSTSSGSDLASPVSGAFTVDTSGYGLISFTILADSTTEGGESLTFYIRSGSVSGTVLTSSAITINDTSTTPAPPPPPPPPTTTYSVANASTNEGSSATANVTTTNVADGTTLYWTVDAGTSDVSTTSGSFAISSNAGSFTIPAIADSTTEGTEYYTISVRTGSTGGTVVASSTLTINDTSTTPPPPPPPPPPPAGTDATPDPFTFADQNDVPISSTIVSSEVQILGINTGAPVSISGGEYSIAIDPTTYTLYTSSPGTIYYGQSIKVRHTSSASNNTSTSTTLTIGGVSDVFTSTTIGAYTSGLYGLQIFDEFGHITLDTSDITIKDLGFYTIPSVTTNGTITGVPMTTNSIALVNNNNGDGDTAIAAPIVTLAPASSSIVVSGGTSGFDVSIRLMEF